MERTAVSESVVPASAYTDHREYVLAILSRRCGWLAPEEREAILHDAFAVLLEKSRNGTIDVQAMHSLQIRGYLVQTALHKALDEGKRAWRKRSVTLTDQEDGDTYIDAGKPVDEVVAAGSDRARLLEILADLPERQQAIVKLRFFFEREPPEIQHHLGVTERVYRRELERAMRRLADRFELVANGTYCEDRRSVILALVAGIAGPTRAAAARRHLRSCPACASWAGELRAATRQSAAMLPLPVLQADDGAATVVRERLAQVLGEVKQQLVGLLARADPATVSAAAGARPGAVAATVAACTLACGATYGTVAPVRNAIRGALDRAPATRPAAERTAPGPDAQRRVSASPRAPVPVVTPRPTAQASVRSPVPRHHQTSKKRTARDAKASSAPDAAGDTAGASAEFGLEGAPAATPVPTASAPRASVARTLPPSESGSSDEFGP